MCRHVKLQTAESPNTWQFPSFKLFFAVSHHFHSSFKAQFVAKGELNFSGRENWKSGTSLGIGFLNFAPGKMQFPLNSEFETGV